MHCSVSAFLLAIGVAHALTIASEPERAAQAQDADNRARTILARSVDKIDWHDVPARNVFMWLMAQGDVKVEVDWQSLAAIDVAPDTTVTLHLKRVTVEQVLTEALDGMSSGARFTADSDTIRIASEKKLRQALVTRIYDVKDLVLTAVFADRAGKPHGERSRLQRAMQALMEEIKLGVEPQSWDTHGGAGRIAPRYDRQWLIITNTPQVHALLGRSMPFQEDLLADPDRVPPDHWMEGVEPAPEIRGLTRRTTPPCQRPNAPAASGSLAVECVAPDASLPGCYRARMVGTAPNDCPIIEYTPIDCDTQQPTGPPVRQASLRRR